MRRGIFTITVAGALLLASTSALAQAGGGVPAPPPATPEAVPAPTPPPAAQPPPPGAASQPPPPGYAPQPPPPGYREQPPPGYAQQPPPGYAQQPPPPQEDPRPPVELWIGLGFGNAVCDNKKPDSQCPVDGAFAGDLGGAWRFHPHWAVGADLAFWNFKVRDAWRGQLADQATDVKFSSFYFAPFARWYWFDHGSVDGYLQGGLGFGTVTGEASNATGTYKVVNSGIVFPFGIGAEWRLSRLFRLGPQALVYLHDGTRVCETNSAVNAGAESCRDAGKDDKALPWRLLLVGSFTFGHR